MPQLGAALYQKVQDILSPRCSVVGTELLRLTIDHASGALHGLVLQGPHAGTPLHSLGPAALLAVMRHCRRDPQSLRLLAFWMERVHGSPPAVSAASGMSVAEARRILGVDEAASADEVRLAHRRLIFRLHPDRGGSSYLAAQVNRAKEVLLRP